jgi:isopentenyl phosphate kinase
MKTERIKCQIIKLGGSIITDSSVKGSFNKKNTSRLAREIFPWHKGCILVHGTGHIGKPPAIKYNYLESGIIGLKDCLIALEIKESLRQLNQRVIRELLQASIPAIPMDILNFSGESTNAKDYSSLIKLLKQMILNGLVPVFYGDMLPLPDGSFKVISSDFITLVISKILEPENVIFLTDVDGVYSNNVDLHNKSDNSILPYLTDLQLNEIKTSGTDQLDVSGGMRKKVEIALQISMHCNICFIGNGNSRNLISDFINNVPVKGTIVKSKAQ